MSSLTLAARPEPTSSPPPVPWRRMAWVIWRQHRLALAGVGAVFGVPAMYLLITGLQLYTDYAAVTACRPATSELCQRVAIDFLGAHAPSVGTTFALLQVLPALIGAFVGAPLLAREFETGTFRYAWTQGFGRTRWTIAKLLPLAVFVTVAAAAFTVLVAWYWQPIFGAGDDNGPLYPTTFDLLGVALAAWTLAAFAIGAIAGVLIRRVIPAMSATLAVYVGLAFATGLVLRPNYQPPVTTSDPSIPVGAWVLSQGWFKGGAPASLDMINQALGAIDIRAITPDLYQPGPATPANVDPVAYLVQHGFLHLATYQPSSQFWLFQGIEGGWLLVLALLLTAATVWLVRHRAV